MLTQSQGTWPFMSLALLHKPTKLHDILDDMESAFWSQLWGSVKYFAGTVSFDMYMFFHRSKETTDGRQQWLGGDMKRAFLGNEFGEKIQFDCSPFQSLLSDLADVWNVYYFKAKGASAAGKKGEKYREMREKIQQPSFWLEIFDRHMANKEEWKPADVIPDRYPIQTEKADGKQARDQLFSNIVTTEAASHLEQLLSGPLSSLSSLASGDDDAAVSFANSNPEPPQSILDNDTDSGSGRSSPSPSLNSNGKRTMMSVVEDNDDSTDGSRLEAAPTSPLPKAKRSRHTSRAPPAPVVAAPSTSDRVLRPRTRSGPIGRRGETARSSRRIATTID